MLEFVIYATVSGLIFGPIFGLIIVFCYGEYEDLRVKIITIIITMVITGFICSALVCFHKTTDTTSWNNGYCECGGEWEFVNATPRGHNNIWLYYVYKCSNCPNVIEIYDIDNIKGGD